MQAVPGGRAMENLDKADKAWRQLCDAERMPFQEVITETKVPLPQPCLQDFDVVVLGGEWSC